MSDHNQTIINAEAQTTATDESPNTGPRFQWPTGAKTEILSGLTVALALVPEAVAFAFVAGVDPMIGLYSAFFLGLITAVLGGRPGMISGATGAMAVVVVTLVAIHGLGYLFYAVVLCGLLQVCVGVLRLGKLIRMVPHPVMLGFVNGLAIVIGLAQLGSFQTLSDNGVMTYLSGGRLGLMVLLVLLTMGIIFFLPRITKAVPSSLAAILCVTVLSFGINAFSSADGSKPVLTVKDMLVDGERSAAVTSYAKQQTKQRALDAKAMLEETGLAGPGVDVNTKAALSKEAIRETVQALPQSEIDEAIASVQTQDVSLEGGLPIPFFLDSQYTNLMPPLSMATFWIILPYSLVLAGVGLIESLMTLSLIDEMTETRGRGNRECIGQGVANMTCGFFGGMGGCAMIGQSLINVKSGGRRRLSGITAAVCLLLFILLLAPWIEMIPMAALVGVMFMVVIGTFEWTTLKTWHKVPKVDTLIMIFVAAYTVLMHDLATAVILGVIFSALAFAWRNSAHLFADRQYNEFGSRIYQLHGALFFASVTEFKRLFDPANDPDDVVIDFYYTRVYDQSGLEAINAVTEKYAALGKRVHLRHLSEDCRQLLGKAGDLVEANLSEDPHYHVATDRVN